ncbi:MAG: caspase family protein [Deltaproteobacteria bacterium]|nr:caspase family protein [Deltaproteobacteria bacterium]
MKAALLIAVALGPELAAQSLPLAPQRPYALVIGCNTPDTADADKLRYADDDAIQNALLLRELGAEVILLVDPDAESRESYPELVFTPATRANLDAALEKIEQQLLADRSSGLVPAFYLFYSGHGGVENNEGYLQLQDGRLTRPQLRALLERTAAAESHVVIDACKSYYAVFERGAGGRRRPLRSQQLVEQRDLPATVGLLLSTSAAADSHEWEALQGGIFSHEVRSAMRGAADLDADGVITYQETAAFIWSANATIPSRRYRPQFFARPPAGGEPAGALVPALAGSSDRLAIGPGASRHLFVEDGAGRRIADLHPAADAVIALRIPPGRPLFVRQSGSDLEYELPAGRTLALADLEPAPATARPRSAAHVAFGKLFARPFDRGALEGYRAHRDQEVEEPALQLPTWLMPSLAGAGAVVALIGGSLTAFALRENLAASPDLSGVERQQVNDRIDLFNAAAVACYAVAGVAVGAFAGSLAWDALARGPDQVEFLEPPQSQPAAAGQVSP